MNILDGLKEHKKFLLLGLGVILVIIFMTMLSANGIGNVGTVGNNIVGGNDEGPAMILESGVDYSAVIKTNLGDITIDLYEKETPITVNNFVVLADKGFYDGVIFHRVISDFMIQGGDPTGTGSGGPGYNFKDEIVSNITFEPFVLAMANAGAGTNGSQFFITSRNSQTSYLNGRHTIFGKVVSGFDVVDAIERVETNSSDKPVSNVVINTVEIVKK